MIQTVLTMCVTAFVSGVTTYIVGKQLLKDTKKDLKKQVLEAAPGIIDYLIDEVEGYVASPEGAKVIYSIGGLIGNGAAKGFGVTGSRGKFKFEDILGQIAGGFVQRYLTGSNPEPQQNRNVNKRGMSIT